MTKEDVLDFFFKTVEDVIGCVTLPTGDSLIPTFIYSLVITGASAISEFAFHWSFFDFRGALIATVLLLGLAIIERKGVNEISRLCRAVKSGASTLKKRATRPGSTLEAVRGTNPGDVVHEEVGGPSDVAGEG